MYEDTAHRNQPSYRIKFYPLKTHIDVVWESLVLGILLKKFSPAVTGVEVRHRGEKSFVGLWMVGTIDDVK